MLRKYHLLILVMFATVGMTDVLIAQVNTVSEVKLISTLPSVAVKTSLVSVPSEIFFGDTFYCQITRKNDKEKPFWMNAYANSISRLGHFVEEILFVISSEGIEEDYTCVPEIDFYRYYDYGISWWYFRPDTDLVTAYPLELPPLEAMEHPFWKKLRKKMSPDGIKCTMSVKIPEKYLCSIDDYTDQNWPYKYAIYTHEILIKPRLGKEQELLDGWLRDVPEQFLPPLSRTQMDNDKRWYTPEMDAFERIGYRQSGGHFVEINGHKYNPWCFIRDGNRKPPAQICPTTPEGWHQLEVSLESSTMRDEIRFSRMLLEYFGAEGGAHIQKREEIVQWLKSLPEPQSMSMASNLGDEQMYVMYRRMDVDPTRAEALEKPYSELVEELRPMMSHYHQQVFNSLERYRKKQEENQAR